MWKDGKQIFTARWKSCQLSYSPQTPFPTAPPLWPFTHIPTAPAAANILPVLSGPEKRKRKKRTKKEAGASPSALTEGGAPALLWGSVQNSPFPPPKWRRKDGVGNHKSGSRKGRHRRFFSPFSTLIPTLFRACGQVMGTGDECCLEALLARVDAALVDLATHQPHSALHLRTKGGPVSGRR